MSESHSRKPFDDTVSFREAEAVLSEIQVVLSEKRTSLSYLRTGIAVTALPMTIVGFLIATSRAYARTEVVSLLAPLLVACIGLFALGIYMIGRSLVRLHRYDALIRELKRQAPELTHYVD